MFKIFRLASSAFLQSHKSLQFQFKFWWQPAWITLQVFRALCQVGLSSLFNCSAVSTQILSLLLVNKETKYLTIVTNLFHARNAILHLERLLKRCYGDKCILLLYPLTMSIIVVCYLWLLLQKYQNNAVNIFVGGCIWCNIIRSSEW